MGSAKQLPDDVHDDIGLPPEGAEGAQHGFLSEDDEMGELDDIALPSPEGKTIECCTCHKVLHDKIIEEMVDEKTFYFCSERCVSRFEHRQL